MTAPSQWTWERDSYEYHIAQWQHTPLLNRILDDLDTIVSISAHAWPGSLLNTPSSMHARYCEFGRLRYVFLVDTEHRQLILTDIE